MRGPQSWEQPPAEVGEAEAGRSGTIKKRIDFLKENVGEAVWELAELLAEVFDKNYHIGWGFASFDIYIDNQDFDIGAREARYRVKIHKASQALNISREQLKAVKITKLKEIFTQTPPEKYAEDIIRLVEVAKTADLDYIKAEVRRIRGITEEELVWRNFRVTKSQAEDVIDPAIERIKKEYGDTTDKDGNPVDITPGKALELLCADSLSEPDYERERLESEAAEERDAQEVEA